ncbi:sulfurtransferase [Sphaerisporangium rufum]|uniref:Sulfurtransferase n=1 Tax=Sphaerisporangium rufum TaxID=1381558 RepID=A0A919V0U9_9ACTN|nr:rhodanese-like domain-containing protein [Sphaerisporangium rufum]GII80456.1 sulfurtransferase [Sphaerisporangium rufum]
MGIDEYLRAARMGLHRLTPRQAWAAVTSGSYLVDTRPEFQRRRDGEVPGAIVVERNHLEWRLDPRCAARIPEATSTDVHWIVLCDEGYSSSLAAAALRRIGLADATDVIGGFQAWLAAGLPSLRPSPPTPPRGPGQSAITSATGSPDTAG